MTRINTNVSSLVAQNRLQASNKDLQTRLTRLSTGLRINTGADDPAGLIASEALRSEITSLGKAVSNTQRASQIISTADGALGQVSSLLNDVRGLVVEAANNGALSDDEIAANQLQIDSSLEAINRIAQTTTFQGRKLLDGSLDYNTSAGSGFNTVQDLKIDQANLGAVGSISVNVNVESAATNATVSSTGIPATTTAASSTGEITFSAPAADAEASSTVSFADSFTVGAEGTATVAFAAAFTVGDEASADDFVIGNDGANDISLDIDAVDGGAADGAFGNDTAIVVNEVANGTASTSSFDATTNTLTLNVEQGQAIATIVSDLDGSDANFDIAAGTGNTGTDSTTVASGTTTSALAGGTSPVAAGGFELTARDGGAADGTVGNDTELNITAGTTTEATYDAENNQLNVTVADGATIADVANAINAGAGDDFIASNVTNGDSFYSTADNTTGTTPLAGGANDALASSFVVEAINGEAADGAKGNDTTIDVVTGDTTGAAYDADTDTITVTVADGATTQQIADAVDGLDDFLVRNIQNGNAQFDTASGTDVGADIAPAFAGGTNTTGNDVITVSADDASSSFDGTTITLTADNSLAAGTAEASVGDDGNITVNVSSLGSGVATGTIAAAISDLDGFTASVTESNGDGVYDIANTTGGSPTETAATTTALSGGVFGGGLNADLVVQLTGSTGSEVFQFDKGASLANVVQSINLVSDATGISASDDNGTLKLSSTDFGSDALIDVEVINEGDGGTFESGLTEKRATGTDVVATVNGITASAQGNTLSINTSTLDLSLTLESGSSTDVSFDITGGGASFQLGPEVSSTQRASLGISSVSTGQLGGASGRLYELGSGQSKSLSSDINGATKVIDEVINKVTGLRGRLGAFQSTTLDSNLTSLNETRANLQDAESTIRDADFAQESAQLTRAQILVQSGTNVLALANQSPQNVLALIR